MLTRSLTRVLLISLTVFAAESLYGERSREVTIPEETQIRLRFDKALSSQTSKHGEKFTATVVESISKDSMVVVPSGSKVEGIVTVAKPAHKGVVGLQHKEGELDVRWDSLVLPNGVTKEIAAHAIALDDPQNKGKVKDEGTLKGESTAKRDVLQTGIGAGIGAAIGAIAGGGRGTVIGATVGGLAGLGTSAFRKGHDIEIKQGTQIIVQLDHPMTFVRGELPSQASKYQADPSYPRTAPLSQTRGKRAKLEKEERDEDDGDSDEGVRTFSERDARIIKQFFYHTNDLPPGLAKRNGGLPPGLRKQLVRKGHLPPGLQKRMVPFPIELERRLPSLPENIARVILGRDALLIDQESNTIFDVLHDVFSD